jgi:hypothetical protein
MLKRMDGARHAKHCRISLQALILALSTFPGRANRVVLYLCGHITTDELLADTDENPERRRRLGKCFELVKSAFDTFSAAEQQSILKLSLANAIGGITGMATTYCSSASERMPTSEVSQGGQSPSAVGGAVVAADVGGHGARRGGGSLFTAEPVTPYEL